MEITFINKSNKPVYVTLGENSARIATAQRETLYCDGLDGTFTAQVDEASYVRYVLAKFGVVLRRQFKLVTEYEFTAVSDMVVVLYDDKRKGRYMDEYEKIVPRTTDGTIRQVSCRVPDEDKIKSELAGANKRSNNAVKLFDVFDILGNALSGLLLLVIPFILIWIFADIDTASKICGMIYIPMFAVIVLFNRYMDKLKRKVWALLKAKKLEKDIFKDYNSYFDSEYIESVYRGR